MITDKIDNINMYYEIPGIAKDFIHKLDSDIHIGKVVLSDDVYVNVEEYTTKLLTGAKFESHQRYADIQILICGKENIYYTDKYNLKTDIPYDKDKDIEFYADAINRYDKVCLNGTNFVFLLPGEAHAPQVSVNNIQTKVKKVVIKIKK